MIHRMYSCRCLQSNYEFFKQVLKNDKFAAQTWHVPNTPVLWMLLEMPSLRFKSFKLLCRVFSTASVADRPLVRFVTCVRITSVWFIILIWYTWELYYYLMLFTTDISVSWDFPHPSRSAVGLTQHPVQWVSGLFPGSKRSGRGIGHAPI